MEALKIKIAAATLACLLIFGNFFLGIQVNKTDTDIQFGQHAYADMAEKGQLHQGPDGDFCCKDHETLECGAADC